MPLPKPWTDETEKEFISRCVGSDIMQQDYDDNDQRLAVCYSQWQRNQEGKTMERKVVKFEIKAIDEAKGIIEGYGSTFEQEPDSYGDVIDPGAFTKTLQENRDSIVSLFNHNIMEPIGKPEVEVDGKGLFTRIHLVRGVRKAEETLLLAKAGVIKRMSIGYDTIVSEMVKGIRHLKEVRLYDISPVIFAANANATITGVKSNKDIIAEAKETIKALQALLDKTEGKQEPAQATPGPEVKQEAADMEGILNGIEAELAHFDTEQAEARLDQILDKITLEVK